MINLDLGEVMFELKEGAIKHVGPSNRSATVKLYDIEGVDVREFGDKRIKLVFEDEDGNEIDVALFPDQASEVARGIELLEEESRVFE
ncbi:MAG: hypothetical protein ABEH64_07725 [Salinirussus sp.]